MQTDVGALRRYLRVLLSLFVHPLFTTTPLVVFSAYLGRVDPSTLDGRSITPDRSTPLPLARHRPLIRIPFSLAWTARFRLPFFAFV